MKIKRNEVQPISGAVLYAASNHRQSRVLYWFITIICLAIIGLSSLVICIKAYGADYDGLKTAMDQVTFKWGRIWGHTMAAEIQKPGVVFTKYDDFKAFAISKWRDLEPMVMAECYTLIDHYLSDLTRYERQEAKAAFKEGYDRAMRDRGFDQEIKVMWKMMQPYFEWKLLKKGEKHDT